LPSPETIYLGASFCPSNKPPSLGIGKPSCVLLPQKRSVKAEMIQHGTLFCDRCQEATPIGIKLAFRCLWNSTRAV